MNKCKEALEHFETLFTDNSYYKQFDNSFVPFNEDKEALYELIDKEEKYRWHDLRKNPNDLPKKDGIYLIYTEALIPFGYNKSEIFKNYYVREYYSDKNMFANIIRNDFVVAWKYIEEF